jgi:hypothetical protein
MKTKKCEVCNKEVEENKIFIITATNTKKNGGSQTANLCGECFGEGWRCEFIEDNFFFVKHENKNGKLDKIDERIKEIDKIDERKAKDNSKKINKIEQYTKPTEITIQKKKKRENKQRNCLSNYPFVFGNRCYFRRNSLLFLE